MRGILKNSPLLLSREKKKKRKDGIVELHRNFQFINIVSFSEGKFYFTLFSVPLFALVNFSNLFHLIFLG